MSAVAHYDTDLSDEQWDLIRTLLPDSKWQPGGSGRPPLDQRTALNGILYLNKIGCQRRMIPKTYGNWSPIYGYFKQWRQQKVWSNLMETLRQWERRDQGRQAEP